MKKVHINQLKTNHSILEKLHKYYYKENKYTLMFSEKGIFSLDKNTIHSLKIIDDKIIKKNKYYKDFDLWIDNSVIKKKLFFQLHFLE